MDCVIDWLKLHSLDGNDVIRILAYPDCEVQIPASTGIPCNRAMVAENSSWSDFRSFLTEALVPALVSAIDGVLVADLLGDVSWPSSQS
jgi:hypothetical protein